MTDHAIEIHGLRKTFGDRTAVEELSFTVAPGSVTALLGPNGAGKTTLVHLLATLLRPDAGSATVAGHDLLAEPERVRASISLTGQFAAVDEVLTGRQNLIMFGRLQGLSRRAAKERAAQVLADFALTDPADRPVGNYSGGMRRRLDLACSLVVPRPILFLDEPTTGLDPRSRHELWEVVDGLRATGTAVLLTTQYLEEADRLADRVVLIDHGRVKAEGTPAELKAAVGQTVCAVRVAGEEQRETVARLLTELRPRIEGGEVVVPDASAAVTADIARRLDRAGIEPSGLTLRQPSLDEVFFALTGAGAHAEDATADSGAAW
ncbi:ATP-binding cassette domain-containing protein [Nocardia fluminea]|uniref:ATP-binding cassette domain-containing protein n=1 Tax=Nocardia fluminea TaxID=134984 RepID=UPI0036628F5F